MDPIVVIFGLGIGMLVGMTGMGGASLMTPLLILVVGTPPVTAIGTDIFYGAVTKTVGGWRHLKLKTVHRGIAFWLAVGSVPSAIAGVWTIELIQSHYGEDAVNHLVLGMVGAALAVVGVATLLRSLLFADVIPERHAMHLYRRHIVIAIITGAVTGFVIGLTSAGSGTLIAIVLIAVFRLTPSASWAQTSSTLPCCFGRPGSRTSSAATWTSGSRATSWSARSQESSSGSGWRSRRRRPCSETRSGSSSARQP